MKIHTPSPASGARATKILFLAEMSLSPVVAAIALLAPVAFHWGVFKFVPAIFWLAVFVQCLFTYRRRGLWFLLGPLVAFLGIVAYLTLAPPTPAAVSATPKAVTRRNP